MCGRNGSPDPKLDSPLCPRPHWTESPRPITANTAASSPESFGSRWMAVSGGSRREAGTVRRWSEGTEPLSWWVGHPQTWSTAPYRVHGDSSAPRVSVEARTASGSVRPPQSPGRPTGTCTVRVWEGSSAGASPPPPLPPPLPFSPSSPSPSPSSAPVHTSTCTTGAEGPNPWGSSRQAPCPHSWAGCPLCPTHPPHGGRWPWG